MLQLLTTDEFARWFASLDDTFAEEVAGAADVVEQLGPDRAAPGSRESLLWYEHPVAQAFEDANPLAPALEAWGELRDYARRLVTKLESPRFAARLERLPSAQARVVTRSLERIRAAADVRMLWTLARHGVRVAARDPFDEARDELRRAYFDALGAAGFHVADVPAHTLALRELARRGPGPAFRILYGVDAGKETALLVLGEPLDRCFYGGSVRRAEAAWKRFQDGELGAAQPMAPR
jgi:hypothetical protein